MAKVTATEGLSTSTAQLTASEEILAESPVNAVADADELLKDAPKMIPPGALRIRQRGIIMGLLGDLQSNIPDDATNEDGTVSVDLFNNDNGIREMYEEMLTPIDEALERLAVDAGEYAKWAVGDDAEQKVMALFIDYAAKVGKAKNSGS